MRYGIEHTSPTLKPEVLKAYLSPLFIETGTNMGQGVLAAVAAGFKIIWTCEADKDLWQKRFQRFGFDPLPDLVDVGWWRMESPAFLREVLFGTRPTLSSFLDDAELVTLPIREACTIFLDAHAEGSNPLLDELAVLAEAPRRDHIILIDDVRMFGSAAWNGLGLPEITAALRRINPDYQIAYADTNNAPGDLLVARVGG